MSVLQPPRDRCVWRDTTTGRRRPRLDPGSRSEADVVVIGAGLTGLSTALHLARQCPDRQVLVIEADRLGAGASGASTGIVGPGVAGGLGALRRRFGPELAAAMFRRTQEAVDTVQDLVRDAGIDCDLVPGGHLLCAGTRAHARRLERDAAAAADLGLDVDLLGRDRLADLLGHDRYLTALRYRPVVLVNPLKLALGLADAAERAGVRIVEDSPVTEVSPGTSGPWVGTAGGGGVAARQVVVATDGYTPKQLPFGRRIVAVRTHVLATRPLTAAERDTLGWNGIDAVIDQRTFFAYYRLNAQGRLLFGGGPVTRPDAPAAASHRVWRRLERELAEIFPSLRGVPVEYRWSGVTGATIDRLPVVGDVPGVPGALFAGAWSGHGLALSIGSGPVVAARLAAGAASPASAGWDMPWNRSRTGNPRLGPLGGPFVSSYVAALDGVDRLGGWVHRLGGHPPTPSLAPGPR